MRKRTNGDAFIIKFSLIICPDGQNVTRAKTKTMVCRALNTRKFTMRAQQLSGANAASDTEGGATLASTVKRKAVAFMAADAMLICLWPTAVPLTNGV
mmetsp:Transcript_30038/g.44518  ORF Transcript_30038/g.44518 Transcript_30038/m.44518 type:complete len:98 (-) Transcript_30038:1331-1624(-)